MTQISPAEEDLATHSDPLNLAPDLRVDIIAPVIMPEGWRMLLELFVIVRREIISQVLLTSMKLSVGNLLRGSGKSLGGAMLKKVPLGAPEPYSEVSRGQMVVTPIVELQLPANFVSRAAFMTG